MGEVRLAGHFGRDLVTILKALRSRVLNDPGLTLGTDKKKAKIAAASTPYAVDGKVYSKAAADDIAVTGTDTGAGLKCKMLVQVDAAGVVTFKQGPIDAQGDKYPVPDASKCVFGSINIPASFTFGTTEFTGGMFVDGDDPRLNPSVLMGGESVGLES